MPRVSQPFFESALAASPQTNARARLAVAGFVALLVLAGVGGFVTSSPTHGSTPRSNSGEPSISFTPLPGRTLYLATLDDFPRADADDLVDLFEAKYGVHATLLPRAALDRAAWDEERHQAVAESAIASIKTLYSDVASDGSAVIIGLVGTDLYIRGRPDWDWAFGLRTEGRFAIVSTARMSWTGPEAAGGDRGARLRKMVSRYVGFLYFGLKPNDDPSSVLYRDVLGVDDLYRISEDF